MTTKPIRVDGKQKGDPKGTIRTAYYDHWSLRVQAKALERGYVVVEGFITENGKESPFIICEGTIVKNSGYARTPVYDSGMDASKHYAWVQSVRTHHKYQRRGFCSQIMEVMEEIAHKWKVEAMLLTATPAGRKTYEACGWEVIPNIEQYSYPVMRKFITEEN